MVSQVRDVKDAIDIVQLVGEKVRLQRSGRNFRGLCPFHSEKTPSFFVTPELQAYKCFGCGESGDVFTFLEKTEGLTFAEALQNLAARAGITLTNDHFTPEDQRRQRWFELLELAAAYYHYLLTDHQVGDKARQYLKDRKISQEIIREFRIGYALPSWDGLIKFLVNKKKFAIEDLELTGLVIPRQGASRGSKNLRDFYDRFRDRIIFPLTDHRGRVVGFSGRTLDSSAKEAKYINSPETPLYHKSQLLFGYSQHARALRDANTAIVVEGEFDVLSSAQAHVRNVVAIKGSALTTEHLQRLKRTVETVVLSLDADKAGVEATKRAILLAQEFQMRIRVLPGSLLQGKDPDDLAREQPAVWRAVSKQTISAYQFLIDMSFEQHDAKTGEGKQAIVQETAEVIGMIPHAVERTHYVTALAKRLEVAQSALEQDFRQYWKQKKIGTPKVKESAEQIANVVIPPEMKAEQHALSLLFGLPEAELREYVHKLQPEWFQHPGLQQLVIAVSKMSGEWNVAAVAKTLPAELATVFAEVYLQPDESLQAKTSDVETALLRLQDRAIRRKIQDLTSQLEQLEAQGSLSPEAEDQQTAILAQIVQLRQQVAATKEVAV